MADQASSGLSKSAKKNLKRKAAKRRAAAASGASSKPKGDVVTPEELKEVLTRELETAKDQNDQTTMKTLREQIWVVNDMIAGVKTDLPNEELNKILEKLPISDALKRKQKSQATDTEQKKKIAENKANNEGQAANGKPRRRIRRTKANKDGKTNEANAKETQPPKSATPKEDRTSKHDAQTGIKMSIEDAGKKLRSLRKKLKEVRRIKAKLASGEKLEKNQVEKAKLEKSLIEEIDDLELDINTEKLNL